MQSYGWITLLEHLPSDVENQISDTEGARKLYVDLHDIVENGFVPVAGAQAQFKIYWDCKGVGGLRGHLGLRCVSDAMMQSSRADLFSCCQPEPISDIVQLATFCGQFHITVCWIVLGVSSMLEMDVALVDCLTVISHYIFWIVSGIFGYIQSTRASLMVSHVGH